MSDYTDKIMALADTYADGPHMEGYYGAHRAALLAAVTEHQEVIESLSEVNKGMHKVVTAQQEALRVARKELEAAKAEIERVTASYDRMVEYAETLQAKMDATLIERNNLLDRARGAEIRLDALEKTDAWQRIYASAVAAHKEQQG